MAAAKRGELVFSALVRVLEGPFTFIVNTYFCCLNRTSAEVKRPPLRFFTVTTFA
jgi:hypothetical protein